MNTALLRCKIGFLYWCLSFTWIITLMTITAGITEMSFVKYISIIVLLVIIAFPITMVPWKGFSFVGAIYDNDSYHKEFMRASHNFFCLNPIGLTAMVALLIIILVIVGIISVKINSKPKSIKYPILSRNG